MQQEDTDFIKRMKLYQNTFLVLTEQNNIHIKEINDQDHTIHMPNPIYDALMFQGNLILSIRNMPIVIYGKEEGNWQQIYRLHDIKPNSEQFLSPLEMSILEEKNLLVGCGKGFFHEYDLEKKKITNYKSIKSYDFISCLDTSQENQSQNITKNIVLLGFFNKTIKILDTNQDKLIAEAKVHIGGITNLLFDKVDSLYFYSCARFDDYVYQWDLRNTSTFVQYYERKNQTNQRMTFDVNRARQLIVGNHDGTVYVYNNQERLDYNISNSCVHSAIINDDGKCHVAYGQRSFDDKIYETGIQNFTINL